MLAGRLPFDEPSRPAIYAKIIRGEYTMSPFITPPARLLIKQILQTNPLDRLTIPEIKNDPWFATRLPFYLQIMDNSKLERAIAIDPGIFAQVADVRLPLLLPP